MVSYLSFINFNYMNKKLSVIIVTYNSERLIFDCLNSIYKFNDLGDALEVIVVDNNSNDQALVFSKIKNEYPSDLILINSLVNNGYGHGNNQGVDVSSASKFIIMNPDVRITTPIFKKISNYMIQNEQVGLMGVRFIDGSNHLYFKPEYSNLFRVLFHNFLIKLGNYTINEVYFSGSFLIFDKQSFIEAGKFDENIFLYLEEADISNRILKIGKETVLSDDIYVLHLDHQAKVTSDKIITAVDNSRKYYCQKYPFNIKRFYFNHHIIYQLKFIVAILLNNKRKIHEFKKWIEISQIKKI